MKCQRVLILLLFAMVVSGVADLTNTLPYIEPFEAYAPGVELPGTNGWSAVSADAAVVSTNGFMIAALTNTYRGGFPVATNHTKVLYVTESVTNQISTGDADLVEFDCIVALSLGLPDMPQDEQTALGADGSGRLQMMHAYTANGVAFTNEWLALTNTALVASSEWVRVTYRLDYANKMFQISINGTGPLSNAKGWSEPGGAQPGSWFYMANRSQSQMSHLQLSGNLWLDDLSVTAVSGESEPPVIIASLVDGSFVISWDGGGIYNVLTNSDLMDSTGWGVARSGESPLTNAISDEPRLFYKLSD